MVLEATNLLRMVLQNLDSVLLVRNLKSYKRKGPLENVEKWRAANARILTLTRRW